MESYSDLSYIVKNNSTSYSTLKFLNDKKSNISQKRNNEYVYTLSTISKTLYNKL